MIAGIQFKSFTSLLMALMMIVAIIVSLFLNDVHAKLACGPAPKYQCPSGRKFIFFVIYLFTIHENIRFTP